MVDINSVYIVVTYEDCVGIKLRFFTENDKAEAYKEEFKAILRGLSSCYSVKKHEVPVHPDDTWKIIMERGSKLLIQKCNRKQWEKWCSEQEDKK